MERLYIRIYYLKIFHYLFFSLAIFSMTSGIMFFDFVTWESLSFFVLGYFYCVSSLVIAYYYYKDYRQTLEKMKIVRVYFVPYMVLVFWTIGCFTLLVWTFPSILPLVNSFLFVDYYIFFFIVVGFALGKFRLVSKFFEVYNIFVLRRAMKIAKEHASFVDVSEYKIGSDPEMDEILDDIWVHKDYPLPDVRKFETAVCESHIASLDKVLGRMRMKVLKETEKTMMKSFENLREDYMEKIRKIEEKVD
jgi:hypothetical protein